MVLVFSKSTFQTAHIMFYIRFRVFFKAYLYIKSLISISKQKNVLIRHFLFCMRYYTKNKILEKTCEELSEEYFQ